ncbi:MAG TPA: HEAT repeat domain-containing protein, partial [Kofleriaceae bacterium]|nr:HEAT repeat domain-containing protein [Kofleriaceae bacterium]
MTRYLMHDLDVWRRLATTRATASDLQAIANLAIGRRAPYIGRIASLVGDGDPEIRAAAIRALAGCAGAPGVRAVVAALDDDHDDVRAAAIHALMVTVVEAPARSVHALFHSRVDVRRAVLASPLSQAVAEIAIHLRADPECADLAANLAWPATALPLALDLHHSGSLPGGELMAVIARRPVVELRALLDSEHRRSA